MSPRCPYCKKPITRKNLATCNACHNSWRRREMYNPVIGLWQKFLYSANPEEQRGMPARLFSEINRTVRGRIKMSHRAS